MVFDYALDLLSKQARPIPDATWPILLDQATPSDLADIAYRADEFPGQSEIAREALTRAANSGHADVAPGPHSTSESYLNGTGTSRPPLRPTSGPSRPGMPMWLPRAAINLGNLLDDRGDVEGAGRPSSRPSFRGRRPGSSGCGKPREPASQGGRCRGRESGLPAGDRFSARRRGSWCGHRSRGPTGRSRGRGGRQGGLPAGDRLRARQLRP